MKEFVNVMQCGFAAVGGFFGWFVGGGEEAVQRGGVQRDF